MKNSIAIAALFLFGLSFAQQTPKSDTAKVKDIQEVSMTKKVFQKKSDRFVYDVAASPVAKGSTSFELLKQTIRPEFLNRVDDVVLFKPLRLEEIVRIVSLLAEQLRSRLADRSVGLEITPQALEQIAREGYDPVYGARPLKRTLQRVLETPVAKALLRGDLREGGSVTVETQGKELVLRTSEPQ